MECSRSKFSKTLKDSNISGSKRKWIVDSPQMQDVRHQLSSIDAFLSTYSQADEQMRVSIDHVLMEVELKVRHMLHWALVHNVFSFRERQRVETLFNLKQSATRFPSVDCWLPVQHHQQQPPPSSLFHRHRFHADHLIIQNLCNVEQGSASASSSNNRKVSVRTIATQTICHEDKNSVAVQTTVFGEGQQELQGKQEERGYQILYELALLDLKISSQQQLQSQSQQQHQ